MIHNVSPMKAWPTGEDETDEVNDNLWAHIFSSPEPKAPGELIV